MEITGYFASLLIGISLGLIGGGGSILTVPVLVYLFGLQPLQATSYSLFIVGFTSLVGGIRSLLKGQVNVRATLLFGVSSVVTVFFTRKVLVPLIPENIVSFGNLNITESLLVMMLFAVLMIVASISMIYKQPISTEEKACSNCMHFRKLLLYGITIGFITGVLGAGGGFILIPALILILKLPVKTAIGTSLMIIALNSLIGFTGDLNHISIDWLFLFEITAIATAGIFLGSKLNTKISDARLKSGFGWFVLVTGVYIILKETVFK